MEIAMDVSFGVDAAGEGLNDQTWGVKGVKYIIDKVAETGIRRIHWRVNSAGPKYPTRVKGAELEGPCVDEYARLVYGEEDFQRRLLVDFANWDNLAVAAQHAHSKGMTILAWFDQTDNHGGTRQAKWARSHPEFWMRERDGSYPYPDRHLSLAFPEVVEYRLALIREELEDYGLDGLYLTVGEAVKYEEPAVESFQRKYNVNPRKLRNDDRRWIEHRAEYVTSFLRKIREMVSGLQEKLVRDIEIIVEGQGRIVEADPVDEPGWPAMPWWYQMNELVQADTIADEKLADGISIFSLTGLECLSSNVKRKLKLCTRYRMWAEPHPRTKEDLAVRMREAEKRGVSLFVINEESAIARLDQWEMVKEELSL